MGFPSHCSFWVLWFVMLVWACLIIVGSPGCCVIHGHHWKFAMLIVFGGMESEMTMPYNEWHEGNDTQMARGQEGATVATVLEILGP